MQVYTGAQFYNMKQIIILAAAKDEILSFAEQPIKLCGKQNVSQRFILFQVQIRWDKSKQWNPYIGLHFTN